MSLLWILILVVLFLSLGGGLGYNQYGMVGLSPAFLVLLVLVILFATGRLHL